MRALTAPALLFVLLSAVSSPAAIATPATIGALLAAPDPVALDGEPLDGPRLRALYERRGNAPLWLKSDDDEGRVAVVAGVLADAPAHGLDPAPYHTAAIARRRPPADATQAAELDVLTSDALLRYAADMRGGRVTPSPRGKEFDLPVRPFDAVETVDLGAGRDDLVAWLAELPPRQPEYVRLQKLLAQYRDLAAKGGWQHLPEGPTLKRGMTDKAIVALRQRLAVTGDLGAPAGSSPKFDAAVVTGVAHFQKRHGLGADGVVGSGTRAALDVDVGTRIDQIVANLERWRWMPEDLGPRHVTVNVPAYTARLVQDGQTVLEMPVIVGRPDRMTPMLSSQITRITFNPSWTVPTTIAKEDIVTKVRADARYLEKEGIHVFGGAPGARHEVAATKLDLARAGTSDYVLRQPPGPTNPLGRLRFDIPNVNAIYLHDSPKRPLFKKPERALSSGCVRIGDATGLAAALLAAIPEWSADRQTEILKGWETKRVTLKDPVPVHVLYETAWVDDAGLAHFRDDIYGRDKRLAEALRRRHHGAVAAMQNAKADVREGS